MAAPVTVLVEALETELRAVGTPSRALHEKRYLKSELQFLGASVWEIRRIVRAGLAHLELDHSELAALVRELWREPIHERRMAAVALLELRENDLGVADMALVEE